MSTPKARSPHARVVAYYRAGKVIPIKALAREPGLAQIAPPDPRPDQSPPQDNRK